MRHDPKDIAQKYWGFDTFRGSQKSIIETILSNSDVLALMPTGGGKSLCFQIPALSKEGICIVVSPLVALIQDQVNSLKKKGIKAIALIGGIRQDELIEKLDNCVYGNYKFLYLSPERLQQELVLERIQEMNVNLIAIDEAHCISQWGHDFRPAYLKCAVLKTMLPQVPTIALTATATKKVADDIISNLQLVEATIFKDSFERKNISFQVINTEDKHFILKNLIAEQNGSAIIYVRNRRATVELANYISNNGFRADFYHGGLTKDEKKEKLALWTTNKFAVIVATNAFGMGIDKADVRLVIHYQIPENLENYFQETGRAGRDGQPAKAVLFANKEDKLSAEKQFIKNLPTIDLVKKVYKKLNAHLQIAYGDGFDETFRLNYAQFCDKYDFKKNKVFEVLRILDQNSIISFSQQFKEKTSILFTAQKGELFSYLEKNPNKTKVIQTVLRTYGGVFDFETRIDLEFLSKKTGVSTRKIKKSFEKLHNSGLAEFKAGDEDLELTFLVQREDDKTINPIAAKLKQRNNNKAQNFANVLRYVDNRKECRSRILLAYFDEENVRDCGVCDICIERNEKPLNLKNAKLAILEQLKSKKLSSKELSILLSLDKKETLTALQELLEDELIELDARNRYGKIKT